MNPYVIILLNHKCIIHHAVNENGGPEAVAPVIILRWWYRNYIHLVKLMSYQIDLKMIIVNVCQIIICKIDTLALVGMSIFMLEMPVTTVLSQSICIILKQYQLVLMQTFSFGICWDNLIDVG